MAKYLLANLGRLSSSKYMVMSYEIAHISKNGIATCINIFFDIDNARVSLKYQSVIAMEFWFSTDVLGSESRISMVMKSKKLDFGNHWSERFRLWHELLRAQLSYGSIVL